MYCETCGARIDDDSVFCENCGARLEGPKNGSLESADDLEELMNMDKGAGYSEAAEKTMIFRKPHSDPEELEGEDVPEDIEEPEALFEDQNPHQEEFSSQEDIEEEADFQELSEPEEENIDWAQTDERQETIPAQEPRDTDLQEADSLRELQQDQDMWPETETWNSEEPMQENSETENWAEKWGNGPEGSSSWDRGMTNTDEWLQEEIERTMRSLQQSSDHFIYEDRSGTILQGDPEFFDEEFEAPDKTGDIVKEEGSFENPDGSAEPLAGELNQQEGSGSFQEINYEQSGVLPEDLKQTGEMPDGLKQQELSAASEPEAEPTSFPPPIPPLDPEKKETKLLFCMACGKVLPAGAAFCQDCGTPTGEVAPGAVSAKTETGMGIGLLKSFFRKPAGTIERAAADEGFLSGVGFFLIKDVVIAVLAALLTERVSIAAGALSGWLLTDDPFAFAAKIFLCGIVLDALWVVALWAMGKVFQVDCSVKALIGACGTAGLFTAVLFLITILLAAFVPAAVGCGLVITGAVTLIAMVKAASAALRINEDLLLFHMAAAAACYSVILFALLKLCQ